MYKHSIVLLMLFCPYIASAETLLELYQEAERHDPQLKMAHAELLAVLENKPQAQAQLLPQLSLGAEIAETVRNQNWLSGDVTEETTGGYDISLSYSLYHRPRTIRLAQTDSEIQQVQVEYEYARQNLMERLANGYFNVLAANDNLEFAQGAQHAFKRQLEEAQQRFEVGLIAITDVQEARAGYDLSVAEKIQARNQLDNAYEALREITGSYYKVLAGLSEDAPLLGPKAEAIDQWTQVALTQNPQLLAAQYAVDTARQEVERQRAADLPTVDLVGQHRFNDRIRGEDTPLSTTATTNAIGVQLSYSWYEGGAIQSRIRQAQQRYHQALERLEQQRRSIEKQTHNAFLNVLSNISQIKALKQALLSTQTALEAVKTGFEVGTRTSVDVLNAQRDVLDAQRNYARARYDYVLNTLRLKLAAGDLGIEDLTEINDWLTLHTVELQQFQPIEESSEGAIQQSAE